MEILSAYKNVHGECPNAKSPLDSIHKWFCNKDMFASGWKSALAWKEEQDEKLEIEKDVLLQQESSIKGE